MLTGFYDLLRLLFIALISFSASPWSRCCYQPTAATRRGGGKVVPVSGKVTQSNRPLPGVTISFVPDKNKGNTSQFVPTGTVQSDGTYTLQTNGKPGVPPGAYKVTVAAMPPMGAEMGKAVAPPRINPQYADARESDLSIEVKEGVPASSYDLKLKP